MHNCQLSVPTYTRIYRVFLMDNLLNSVSATSTIGMLVAPAPMLTIQNCFL